MIQYKKIVNKRRSSGMLIPTVIIGVLAVALLFLGYTKGQNQHVIGAKSALNMTLETLPLLIFAFIVAGMVQALIPRELISRWLGVDSGMRGYSLARWPVVYLPEGLTSVCP
jgi:uncharacterized membrane protein YraQ (UPF0718 family)